MPDEQQVVFVFHMSEREEQGWYEQGGGRRRAYAAAATGLCLFGTGGTGQGPPDALCLTALSDESQAIHF
jgi:hypothetical protein